MTVLTKNYSMSALSGWSVQFTYESMLKQGHTNMVIRKPSVAEVQYCKYSYPNLAFQHQGCMHLKWSPSKNTAIAFY